MTAAAVDRRPLLIVTNIVAPDRVGAFEALAARTPIELALFGGRSHHATGAVEVPGVAHRHVRQRDVFALAASGRYRAVACGTAGRIALPAAWRGARRARVPFMLWSALWAHPRTAAHRIAGAPLLRRIYRDADALVVYGPHVAGFAAAHGAPRERIFVAPQAVDAAFWGAPAPAPEPLAPFTALAVGRAARYKGEPELLDAWRISGLGENPAANALGLVGERLDDGAPLPAGVHVLGRRDREQLRNLYAGASVLVMAAIETPQSKEPWGLVANEAMFQHCPVIATDVVGAAAGGLVVDGRTGIVVAAGDCTALAGALRRLAGDRALRDDLGAEAARHVAGFSFDAWAKGWIAALARVTTTEAGADAR